MGHSLQQTTLTEADQGHDHASASAAGASIALRFELPTTPDSTIAMEHMLRAALSTVGARAPVVHTLIVAARTASQFIQLHTPAPFYQLILDADADGVSLTLTDYVPPVFPAQPAWHPASSHISPRSGPENPSGGTLQLHHSTDGYTQLTAHSAWRNASSGLEATP
ncbi:hypothetical protein [Streptomyces sp. NPDC095817]|uniref:hypothetical protein n=1 Tax=Streptomyces sp. NPDC095817 TaxID=3155082 RepID=UPI003316F70E